MYDLHHYQREWWFSVVGVVGVLTDSENFNDYWYKMKIRVFVDSGITIQ